MVSFSTLLTKDLPLKMILNIFQLDVVRSQLLSACSALKKVNFLSTLSRVLNGHNGLIFRGFRGSRGLLRFPWCRRSELKVRQLKLLHLLLHNGDLNLNMNVLQAIKHTYRCLKCLYCPGCLDNQIRLSDLTLIVLIVPIC